MQDKLGSAVGDQFVAESKRHAPAIINWSNAAAATSNPTEAEDAKKKQKAKPADHQAGAGQNWLSDFLGVDKSAASKQDAASLTKLSVTLKKDNNRQGS